jgi:hypothetical protein
VEIFVNALGAITLGASGWVVLEFIGRPVREFFNLRREVKKLTLLYYDAPYSHNVEPADRAEVYQSLSEAREAFVSLSALLVSFDRSEPMAAWFVRKLGFDPDGAGKVLKGIAQNFGVVGEERDKPFRLLDAALRFRFDPKRHFYDPYNPGSPTRM